MKQGTWYYAHLQLTEGVIAVVTVSALSAQKAADKVRRLYGADVRLVGLSLPVKEAWK